MDSKPNNMSDADIWDDSALIDSWNHALEEYKKYHSIHVTGIPPEEEEDSAETRAEPEHDEQEEIASEAPAPLAAEKEAEAPLPGNGSKQAVSERREEASRSVPAPPTEGLLNSVQDEGLKRLMMSWYYAGYYTGLYEGQRKGKESSG